MLFSVVLVSLLSTAVGQSACAAVLCKEGYLCEELDIKCENELDCVNFICKPISEMKYCGGAECQTGEVCKSVEVQCLTTPCHPVPECVPEEQARCANEICKYPSFCSEKAVPCFAAPCPVQNVCEEVTYSAPPTAETNNCNNMCTSDEECVAVPNACPAMPCPPVHVCQQKETCGGKICVDGTVCTKNDDHCTNPLRCEPKLICDSRICCLAVAVCKEGYELSSSCSEDDYDSGECLWERMCCSSISCKKYAFLLINYSLVVVFVKLLIDVEYDTLQGSDGLSVVPRLSLLHF